MGSLWSVSGNWFTAGTYLCDVGIARSELVLCLYAQFRVAIHDPVPVTHLELLGSVPFTRQIEAHDHCPFHVGI
tara:strand:+ start:1595 stop:1816 length:222 start_codon:yes stop_codon:yes gene_type:complete